ncbi:hypothetical protein HJ01_02507 [Flavobacterium frigoris PS1]|uniref:Uncharacterized protein n=1 Tax=Flavobacterium frigoris (strain PS1) TaxID=1086011 RepID=H7FSE2_FLAFP|nr:hypothetical protein HJ01_02507 [Flavobacterium frigoris PS1]
MLPPKSSFMKATIQTVAKATLKKIPYFVIEISNLYGNLLI